MDKAEAMRVLRDSIQDHLESQGWGSLGDLPQAVARYATHLSNHSDRMDGLEERCQSQHRELEKTIGDSTAALVGMVADVCRKLKEMEQQKAHSAVKEIHIVVPKAPKRELKERPHLKLDAVLRKVVGVDIDGERERLNVVLIGPAGSGKSYLGEQVGRILDLPCELITCPGMSEGQFLGRLIPAESAPVEVVARFKALIKAGVAESAAAAACGPGAFRYVRSPWVKCYEEGGIGLLDEMDCLDQSVSVVLNTALAGKRMPVPNRPEKPYAERHPNFICIGTMNTWGTGADRQYVAANQLPESFLDRFRNGQVLVEYDPSLEAYLCPDDELRQRLQHYRTNCVRAVVRRIISSRFLRGAYIQKLVGDTDEEIDEALFGGWTPDEKSKAKQGWPPPKPKPIYATPAPRPTPPKEEEKDEDENAPPAPNPNGTPVPICPSHNIPMCRMAGNPALNKPSRGWRCAIVGNTYDPRRKQWSVCNYAVWDNPREVKQ